MAFRSANSQTVAAQSLKDSAGVFAGLLVASGLYCSGAIEANARSFQIDDLKITAHEHEKLPNDRASLASDCKKANRSLRHCKQN
jgi:hypothetical protein